MEAEAKQPTRRISLKHHSSLSYLRQNSLNASRYLHLSFVSLPFPLPVIYLTVILFLLLATFGGTKVGNSCHMNTCKHESKQIKSPWLRHQYSITCNMHCRRNNKLRHKPWFWTFTKIHSKNIYLAYLFLNKDFYILDINDKDCKNNKQMRSLF